MSKFLKILIFLVIIFFLVDGFLFFRKKFPKTSQKIFTFLPRVTEKKEDEEKAFKWGVGVLPYPTNVYSDEVLDEVFKNAKDLGVKWVRLGWPPYKNLGDFEFFDKVVDKANEMGFFIVFTFDPDGGLLDLKEPENQGKEDGYKIAKHYKGKIKYYQMANEPAGTSIKSGGFSGLDKNSFDPKKYQKVSGWLKGVSKGIKEADPNAKRILTGHWLHVGFFEMINGEGIEYEIIGWDWDLENQDLTKIKNEGKEFNLIEALKKYNKELWIMEANSHEGSLKGEEVQANYIESFGKRIYETGDFKGFFVFTLIDEAHKQNTNEKLLGLVKIEKADGTFKIGAKKKAFYTYQDLIKSLKK